MDLQEVGCGYMDWIGLAQDRDRWWTLVSAVMNLQMISATLLLLSLHPAYNCFPNTLSKNDYNIMYTTAVMDYILVSFKHWSTYSLKMVEFC